MVYILQPSLCVVAITVLIGGTSLLQVQAADIPANAVAQYWGQNSAESDGSGTQKNLASYCDDSTDILVLSFLCEFNLGGLPVLDFAGACTTKFDGTKLLHCPSIAKDIKTCQSRGKKILLSLGGASGSYGFDSDDEATDFAQTLYDMFGGGDHKYRPFDDAVIDGFDFDIEGGGSTGYATLSKALKSLSGGDLLITGAPQCPFPDAMLNNALNNGMFDAVFVQFYNNFCSASGSNFNFDRWDKWATTDSKNKDVKVFFGLPGSSSAAGSGYIPFGQIKKIVADIKQYDSYGGVMFWDASQSYGNTDVSPNLASAVGDLVHGGSNDDATPSAPAIIPDPSRTTSALITIPRTLPLTTSDQTSCINNQWACVGSSFATCENQQWVIQPCALGLYCHSTTDGSSVYCAPNNTLSLTPNHHRVHAQFSVTNTTRTFWSALINARRTDLRPFGSHVVLGFNLAPHLTVVSVEHGQFHQVGNKVTLQIRNPHRKSMHLVVTIKGVMNHGGVFVAPSSTSIKFQS
ncbi:glycoside hydrolase superfamily [Chlamydoabsidia padenii]|nr:glycoside hydrolase superfamily [Chlamydoabsidia padenii]